MARKFTHKTLRALKPGETLADPGCRGLRARARKGGVFFELRFKHPTTGAWQ